MNSKRLLVAAIFLFATFTLIACKSSNQTSEMLLNTTVENIIVNETVVQTVPDSIVSDTTLAYNNHKVEQTLSVESTENIPSGEQVTVPLNDDPASWSTERIVEEYKSAARKSNSTAKSIQSITLKDISVNNGEYDNVMSFVGGIIGKFLESNSTEKTGITGGFENLAPQDINSAKAYRQGSDTVIEMLMVEQTSGAKEDALSGSVGHAITAVGDISVVVNDLAERGLPLELSEEDTKIYYTNPVVKVVINDNGEIVSGAWSYTVEIRMDNFIAFGQSVNTASIVMDNTITV